MTGTPSVLSDHRHFIWGGILSQVAGAEALNVGPSWLCSVFFLCCFPPSHTGNLAPEQGSAEAEGAPVGSRLMSATAVPAVVCCLFRLPQLSPSFHSGPASGASPLCRSQRTTARSLCRPLPVVQPRSRTGGARVYSPCISGCELWWSSGCQRFGPLH